MVVPAKDERLGISKTLRSILGAGVLSSDIYVIDDGSSDGTGEIARALAVNVLRNPTNIGKARSLARITYASELTRRYDYVCLMDADTEVCRDYFRAVRATLKDPEVAAVCGRAKSAPHNWLTSYRCLAYWISHAIYKAGQSNMGVITVTPGCAAAFRADAFSQLEWNNDTIVEDMDCTIQVHRKKLGKIVYQRKAVVSTQDPRTLRDYIKQMYRWHTGAWQVGRKYGMISGRSKIDWEYKLLMGEGVIFGLLFLLLPVWLRVLPTSRALYGRHGLDGADVYVTDLRCVRLAQRCPDLLAAVHTPAFCRLFGFSLQLLENGGSRKTGPGVVCS